MNRNKFILSMLATIAFPTGAFSHLTHPLSQFTRSLSQLKGSFSQLKKILLRNDKGFKIKSGEGRIHGHMEMRGTLPGIMDLKISGIDTDGDLAIFEQSAVFQGRGWPLHVHYLQDKTFYITEGEYLFIIGDEKHQLKGGDTIFLPRKVPHAWTQLSETGKVILTIQPAGKLESFFVAVAGLTHDPTPSELNRIFTDHEMEIVGPSLRIE